MNFALKCLKRIGVRKLRKYAGKRFHPAPEVAVRDRSILSRYERTEDVVTPLKIWEHLPDFSRVESPN